ncbi:MAG: leucine-rich repeat domain-containing protein [Lewinellaceae bacterium]|nr:leucine-rich repeat domain-containing protein [Lewinellaceae bacterium]
MADLKHLQYLNCSGTHVSDLNALSNLDLHHLNCQNTKLSDLRPLKK